MRSTHRVFISPWSHWLYSLSTVALPLRHSNQSSLLPEGRSFSRGRKQWLSFPKHNKQNNSFFHVPILQRMKGWNPQMVSCVLCWWCHHPEHHQHWANSIMGILFALCFIDVWAAGRSLRIVFFRLWEVVPQPTQPQLWRLGLPPTKKRKCLQAYKTIIKVNLFWP